MACNLHLPAHIRIVTMPALPGVQSFYTNRPYGQSAYLPAIRRTYRVTVNGRCVSSSWKRKTAVNVAIRYRDAWLAEQAILNGG